MKILKAISLDSALWTKLDELVKQKGKSISKLVEDLLNQVLEKKAK